MSLASDYATRQAAVRDKGVEANASIPDGFHASACDGRVETDGCCCLLPGTGSGSVTLSPDEAIALSDWLVATFRD